MIGVYLSRYIPGLSITELCLLATENLVRSATCPVHVPWDLNLVSTRANGVVESQLSVTNFVSSIHNVVYIILYQLEQSTTTRKHGEHKGCNCLKQFTVLCPSRKTQAEPTQYQSKVISKLAQQDETNCIMRSSLHTLKELDA